MRSNTLKRQRRNRAARPALTEFAELFQRCWVCPSEYLLATHEITSGPNRAWGREHRESWLRLCCHCHDEVIHGCWHTTELMAREYALKRIRDPKFYDRPLLNQARGHAPDAISADDVEAAHKDVMGVICW